jgi:hypothetical protein
VTSRCEPLIAAVGLALVLACGPGAASGGSDSTSSGSDDSGDGDGDGDETGDWRSCNCTDAEICVADCYYAPPPAADFLENYRCVDAQPCIELGPHTRECVEAACGSAFGWAQHCGNPAWADLLCNKWANHPCDEIVQDCPDGEKCVVALDGAWPNLPSSCRPVVGPDAPGEPCTSVDSFTDSCSSEAMCWSGELVAEPFEGTCQPFCIGTEEQPSCPDDLACVLVAPDFHLCL